MYKDCAQQGIEVTCVGFEASSWLLVNGGTNLVQSCRILSLGKFKFIQRAPVMPSNRMNTTFFRSCGFFRVFWIFYRASEINYLLTKKNFLEV